jgi:hypothetical protein
MYWMLLPPSANAGRHIEPYSRPPNGAQSGLLRVVRDMISRLYRARWIA